MRDGAFRDRILCHWRRHGRHDLPWRKNITPYAVLVSEIMLQQTQVPRVMGKFREFRRAFPSFRALARASTADVLRRWQGLGYNRRALMLHRCAQVVVRDHRGALPRSAEALQALPGIGPYTAGAIMAFAFNEPVPVIETNIRRVILHHYFPRKRSVSDRQIMEVVERTLDRVNPRRWYAALMDYGSWLAGEVENPNRRSKHYAKQAKFDGSQRQLRGRVLAQLLARRPLTSELRHDKRLPAVLTALRGEGFV